jgi:hypothetical protein
MTPRREAAMEQTDLRARVVALEQWRVQKDIDSARHDERWKTMDDKIDAVGKKVDDVNGTLKFINKLIIGGFVAALLALVWKAGIAP